MTGIESAEAFVDRLCDVEWFDACRIVAAALIGDDNGK